MSFTLPRRVRDSDHTPGVRAVQFFRRPPSARRRRSAPPRFEPPASGRAGRLHCALGLRSAASGSRERGLRRGRSPPGGLRPPCGERPHSPGTLTHRPTRTALALPTAGIALRVWTPPLMQAFWKARCVKYIRASGCGFSGRGQRYADRVQVRAAQEVQLVCPRPFALTLPPSLPPTSGAGAVGSRETLSRQPPPGRTPSSSAVPRRYAPLVSRRQLRRLGRKRQPRARPASFRQPNDRHCADALSRWPVAEPDFAARAVLSRRRSGREVAPRFSRREGCRSGQGTDPGCSASSPPSQAPFRSSIFFFGLLLQQCGVPGRAGGNASSSFLTLAVPWGTTRPNSATAKRRPPLPGCAHAAHCRSSVFTATTSVPLRRPPASFFRRLTNGLTGGDNLTSWPSFSRPQ